LNFAREPIKRPTEADLIVVATALTVHRW